MKARNEMMSHSMTQDQKEYLKALYVLSPTYAGVVPMGTLMDRLALQTSRFMEVHYSLLDLKVVRVDDQGVALHGKGLREARLLCKGALDRVPNRRKLRQEYLKKKAKAYSKSAFFGLVLLPFASCSVLFGVIAVVVLIGLMYALFSGRLVSSVVPLLFVGLAIGFVLWIVTWMFWVFLRDELEEARIIPYVPPVTVETLPAEEVLVRGAEEPAAIRETLLRATTGTEETKAEELLRSAQE